jgi:DNA-binding SARP family transcriptional activator
MPRLRLALLGSLHVTLDGEVITGFAYDKVRALLAYLVMHAERPPLARETLAALLWPDQPDALARKSLRTALATLRQALGDATAQRPFLLTTTSTIQFSPASDYTLDIATFRARLAERAAHQHPAGELCAACATSLEEAVALYSGDFLAQIGVRDSVAFDEWLLRMREELHRQALEALAHLSAYYERRGDDARGREYAWRQLALESWDESAHCCLMRVLARSGQRTAALAQYERCRQILAEELGVEPSAETTALYERIRAGSLDGSVGERQNPVTSIAADRLRPSLTDERPPATSRAHLSLRDSSPLTPEVPRAPISAAGRSEVMSRVSASGPGASVWSTAPISRVLVVTLRSRLSSPSTPITQRSLAASKRKRNSSPSSNIHISSHSTTTGGKPAAPTW